MKKTIGSLLLAASVAAAVGCAHSSEPASVDLTGNWTGYVIMGNGTRADILMQLAGSEGDYTGTLRGAAGSIPEMRLRNIRVVGDTLTYEFDFDNGSALELIRVRLRYSDGALSGSYVDGVGDSDRIYFERGS